VRRRLFVPGYYSGFSNNKMSLDIAIVLAYLTGRTLVPYRFRLPRRAPVDEPADCAVEPMLVPDLFDIPLPYSNEYLLKTWISVPGVRQCVWAPVVDSVLSFPAIPPTDDVRFRQFRNGRPHIYTLGEEEDDAPDLHIYSLTLGHYSYVFYLDDVRRRQVVDLMKRVQPKRPYLSAAERIAASIGSFNAIHVRRGDFLRNELAKQKITRTTSVSGEEVVSNLASRMQRDDPLVICTDGSPSEEIFGPIRQYFRETIFLDSYLRGSSSVREMIAQLPRNDESVTALLTQLVASKARFFAGTLFSTFTALIHRLRGFDSQESRFLYCHNDFRSPLVRFERCEFLPVDDGPFTWNRIRYPVSPDMYSWMREWPESSDSAPPRFEGEASPPGTLDFQAGEAAVHGSTIRHGQEDGGPPMIVDWTDRDAFVTWDVVLAAESTYSAEIRYACNEDSAGSCYGVGICGGDELRAHVWNTGGWESLSQWLRLGRLRVPAGSSKLMVRFIQKDARTVMNLFGVRLVPTESAA
jgi:hypothetical protein